MGDNEPICIAEEVPFEIPDSWEWVRLVNISKIQEGAGIRSYQYKHSGIQILTVTNILENSIDLEKSKKYISEEEYLEKYTHLTPQVGDIVTACSGGSWGKTAIFDKQDIMLLNTSTLRLRFFNDCANNMYLYYITKSDFFKSQLRAQLSGMQPNFGYAHYSKIFIPLPPLSEQQRIVNKLKELEPYIKEYDIAYEKIERLNNNFPEQLKKSILQEAVQGKLVPQNPKDEPASVLIERIREEKQKLIKEKKIKKDKNESYIFRRDNSHYEKIGSEERCIDDEIPFDIPDSWEWIRLGIITEILRGKGPKYTENTEFKILNQKCVRWGNIDISFCKTVDKQWFESISKECLTKQKDILINSTGEGTIGRSSTVTSDAVNMPYDSHVLLIRPYKCLNKYLEIFINGIEGQAQINRSKGAKTTKQTELGVDKTKNLLIPLPPLNEQQRIVDKVNQLLPQISKL